MHISPNMSNDVSLLSPSSSDVVEFDDDEIVYKSVKVTTVMPHMMTKIARYCARL